MFEKVPDLYQLRPARRQRGRDIVVEYPIENMPTHLLVDRGSALSLLRAKNYSKKITGRSVE
ncbi:hypothetical protein BOX15_Mlig031678g2, partial [Macrostomum lignano]